MCGIAGFTHKNWSPDSDRIRRAAATLVHRGPDQQGVFQSEICSLGATRLKIIDLEGGDQPIFSPNGDAVIVFNGEIYNHLELRAELESLAIVLNHIPTPKRSSTRFSNGTRSASPACAACSPSPSGPNLPAVW